MTLQAFGSGPLSLNDVRVELQNPSAIVSLNDGAVRALGVKPTGSISMYDLYGKSYSVAVHLAGTLSQVNLANLVDSLVSGFRKRVEIHFGNYVLIKGTIGSPALNFGAKFTSVGSNYTERGGVKNVLISGCAGSGGMGATAGANNGTAGNQGWPGIRTYGSGFDINAFLAVTYGGGGGGGGGGGAYLSAFSTTVHGTSQSGTQVTLRSAGGGGGGGAGGQLGSGGCGIGGIVGSGQTTGNASTTKPIAGSNAIEPTIKIAGVATPGSAEGATQVTVENGTAGVGGSGGYCSSTVGSTTYWARGGSGGAGGVPSNNGIAGSAGTYSASGSAGQGGAGGVRGETIIYT